MGAVYSAGMVRSETAEIEKDVGNRYSYTKFLGPL